MGVRWFDKYIPGVGVFLIIIEIFSCARAQAASVREKTKKNVPAPHPAKPYGKGPQTICDIKGDYELVSIDRDLYIRKRDGSETRRLTNTPRIDECGQFVENTDYVAYYEKDDQGLMSGTYYVISRYGDDTDRKEISWEGYKKIIGR